MLFKTLSITSRYKYKMPLEDYLEHFEGWLEAFKEGDLFEEIVEGFDHDWSSIYKELHRIFKRDVWNQVLEQRARERDRYNGIPTNQFGKIREKS